MPYITTERRDKNATTAGELSYKFTLYIVKYLKLNGVSYQTINDILGALEGTKQEFFYRRIAAPYEDRKKDTNGDVY